MGKATGAKVNRDELAVLAGSVGLVSNDDAGRAAFKSWLASDNKAARAALFGKVKAKNVAAGLAAAKAVTARSSYPTIWLRMAGVRPGAKATGPRITEAGD